MGMQRYVFYRLLPKELGLFFTPNRRPAFADRRSPCPPPARFGRLWSRLMTISNALTPFLIGSPYLLSQIELPHKKLINKPLKPN